MSSSRHKLTEAIIRAAVVPSDKSQTMLWDSAVVGLGVRCLRGGTKTWVFVYRPSGVGRAVASQTLRLGAWPALSVDDARKAARGHAGNVARGGDPASQRREVRRREQATLRKLLAEDGPYERDLKRRGIVNLKSTLSSLRRGLKRYMNTDVAALTRQDLVSAIAAIADDRPGAASDLRKHSRTLCEWAVSRGLAPANVMAGLRNQPRTRAERLARASRGRALADGEMHAVWQAAGEFGAFGGIARLGLLGGFRRAELAGLRWSDVGSDRITLPAEATKTGWEHAVPLTDLTRAVLTAQPRTTSKLVFPSPVNGRRMQGWTKLTARLRRASGVDFTLHDLRRSCRTVMSRLGVPEDVAELAIGHRRADLVGRYNKDEAWQHRVDAFERVSAHIAALVGGDVAHRKVVALPGRR
jgi:integrase